MQIFSQKFFMMQCKKVHDGEVINEGDPNASRDITACEVDWYLST